MLISVDGVVLFARSCVCKCIFSSSILIRRPFEWFVTKFPLYFHHVSFIYYFKLGTQQFKYWHSHGFGYSVCSNLCVSLYVLLLLWKWKYLSVCINTFVCDEYINNHNNNNKNIIIQTHKHSHTHTITQICRGKQFPQTKLSMKLFTLFSIPMNDLMLCNTRCLLFPN